MSASNDDIERSPEKHESGEQVSRSSISSLHSDSPVENQNYSKIAENGASAQNKIIGDGEEDGENEFLKETPSSKSKDGQDLMLERDDCRREPQSGDTNSSQNVSQQGQNKERNIDKSDKFEDELNVTNLKPIKAKKRAIFVSYSPEASLQEKMFICYTVKELKNIGFCDDVWFDRDEDEMLVCSPTCFQQRMEIAEKCRAALIFLSESYFSSRSSKHEAAILLGRVKSNNNPIGVEKPVKLFCVRCDNFQLPHDYMPFQHALLDLSISGLKVTSIAEKSSLVIAAFSEEMEDFAPLFGLRAPSPPPEPETPKEFMKKQISTWSVFDVQEWLTSLKIHPRFNLSFEENQIDGFLLLAMTERDMEEVLGVDNRIVRRKIQQQMKVIQERESQTKINWFLKLKKVKGKIDSVYVIFDPHDTRLVQNLKRDLVKKNIQVHHHNRLGQSKDDFLQLNSPHMAVCHYTIVVMTTASAPSLFVYNEILFVDWLEKPIIVLMFNNSWTSFRSSVQSILGGCPSIDFEHRLYSESLDVLMYHIKPLRHMPAVILEQDFLNRMVDGLKPLKVLVSLDATCAKDTSSHAKIFLSYHWDVQKRVQALVQHLENYHFECWTDVQAVAKQPSRAANSLSLNSRDSLQSQIQRNMKEAKAVVCCVTQKYICSNNCANDLALAELLGKPIVPLLFEWISWPPESGAVKVRKILAPHTYIDLSNDKLYKRSLPSVVTYLKKLPDISHG